AKANVYGPEGTKKWIDALFEAYPYLEGKLDLEVKELKDGETVALGSDTITCASTFHSPDSIAYRIDSASSVVYSGDTEPCGGMKTLLGSGTDVLIHECSVLDSSEHREGHTTPTALGEFLKNAPVKTLVLTHFSSEIPGHEGEIVEILKRYFTGKIVIGEDLLSLKAP
ncbi:MAG: MBL fold metallo-hydrolase, partial [Candidatus Hydrothermarchaeaceae archaeon]